MNLMELTQEKIEFALSRVVPEIHLSIAKHIVLGMSAANVAESFGFEEEEVRELTEGDEEYQEVESYVRKMRADSQTEMDISWDGIEQKALTNLSKSVQNEADPDVLLRIASVANKAQRRHQSRRQNTLTQNGGAHVHLKLTQRFVEKINSGSNTQQVEERSIEMVIDSANPPSQGELGGLFDYSNTEGLKNLTSRADVADDLLTQLTDGIMDV